MLISTRQLRAFQAVVKYGNFTKAADRLHVTQAGLSGMIRDLEAQLQCRLFNRTTRTVELTEAGSHLLPFIERVLENLDAGIEGLGYVKELRQGRLRIGTTPYMAATVMPQAIKEFARLRPDLRLELIDAEQSIVQRLVDSGELDAGYGYLFNLTANVRSQSLFGDPLTLIVPQGAYEDCTEITEREDWKFLRDATLIVLDRNNPLQVLVNAFLADTEAPAFPRREARHLATVIGMVASGLGIALLPKSVLPGCRMLPLREISLGLPTPVIQHICLSKAGTGDIDGLDEFSRIFTDACSSGIISSVKSED